MGVLRGLSGRVAALLVLALTAIGCASLTIDSYADRGFNLQRYHTFNWGAPDVVSTGDPRLDNNQFFDERVRLQVERELASRGFEKTATEAPDVLVHYHASVTQKIDIRNLDAEYDACEEGDCEPYVYDAGTLFIDLVDRRTNRLVWRGWAAGSIDGVIDDQEWLEKRIDETVARILDRLPRGL
jgi:hypothetical protein